MIWKFSSWVFHGLKGFFFIPDGSKIRKIQSYQPFTAWCTSAVSVHSSVLASSIPLLKSCSLSVKRNETRTHTIQYCIKYYVYSTRVHNLQAPRANMSSSCHLPFLLSVCWCVLPHPKKAFHPYELLCFFSKCVFFFQLFCGMLRLLLSWLLMWPDLAIITKRLNASIGGWCK